MPVWDGHPFLVSQSTYYHDIEGGENLVVSVLPCEQASLQYNSTGVRVTSTFLNSKHQNYVKQQ